MLGPYRPGRAPRAGCSEDSVLRSTYLVRCALVVSHVGACSSFHSAFR